jgi:hypothetical protein
MSSRLTAYDPELEVFEGESDQTAAESSGMIDEMDEMTIAAEFLEIRNEEELNGFLTKLIRRVVWAAGPNVPHDYAKAVQDALRRTLNDALGSGDPAQRSALSQIGATLGSRISSLNGAKLGLELEGLSDEDREFETARQLVRFVTHATQNAILASDPEPGAAARAGLFRAARRYAPGLLHGPNGASTTSSDRSPHRRLVHHPPPPSLERAIPLRGKGGRWVRQGSNIIILDTQRNLRAHRDAAMPQMQEVNMHNIDRNMLESNHEGGSFEAGNFEYEQYEGEGSSNETWSGEGEMGWSGEGESFEAYEGEAEAGFNESELMELAAELLEVTNEQELDQFLGGVLRKVGSFVRSPAGRALGGLLKGVAKKALPIAGAALGTFVGGPLGGKIGHGLASAAGQALGLEAESLSYEDREFEGAKQFVRIAGQAARQVATAGGNGDPRTVAQTAVMNAVRRHAPGLLQPNGQGQGRPQGYPRTSDRMPSSRNSGRWIRRGNRIILLSI